MSISNLMRDNGYSLKCKDLTTSNKLAIGGEVEVLPTATGIKYSNGTSTAYLQIKNNDLNNLYWNNTKITGFHETNIYSLTAFTNKTNILNNDVPLNNIGLIQVNMLVYGNNTKIIREYNFMYDNTTTFNILNDNCRIFGEVGSITVEFTENNGNLEIYITPTETCDAKISLNVIDL